MSAETTMEKLENKISYDIRGAIFTVRNKSSDLPAVTFLSTEVSTQVEVKVGVRSQTERE